MQLTNEWYCFLGAIDAETCDQIIALGGEGFRQAAVGINKSITPEERIKGQIRKTGQSPEVRTSEVKWLKQQWLYDRIWPYMLKANRRSGWRFDIRAAESMQLTRYPPGGFYEWHRDGKSDHLSAYQRPGNKSLHGHVRKLSMTLLLNDDFEGGEFQFACYRKGKFSVEEPQFHERGSIVLFPSFMEHRVAPVTQGTRYSLVVWFLGPPFV